MTNQQIAKTIVDTLFAIKIVNTLKLKQTIKQTGNIETSDSFQFNSLTVIDTNNNTIVELKFETQTVNVNHNIKVKFPELDYNNSQKLIEYIVGLPIIKKLNQTITDFKHITIKTVKNTYHIIDTKTKKLIAVLRFTIPSTVKQLVNKIINLIKNFYSFTTKNKLPFVIGLLGGFILSPFANKVLSIFNYVKKENLEPYLESELVNKVKTMLANITQRLLAVVMNMYKKFTNVISIVISFIGGLLLGSRNIVENTIKQFTKFYENTKSKMSAFMTYVTINVLKAVHQGLYIAGSFLYSFNKIIELVDIYLHSLRKSIKDYIRYLQIYKTDIKEIYPELVELDNLLLQNQKRFETYLTKIDEVFSVDELLYHGYYSDQVLRIIEDFSDIIKQDIDIIIHNIEVSIERLDRIESEETKKTSREILVSLIDKLRPVIVDYLAILRYVDFNALFTYEKRFNEMIYNLRGKYYKTNLLGSLIRTREWIKDLQKQSIDKL